MLTKTPFNSKALCRSIQIPDRPTYSGPKAPDHHQVCGLHGLKGVMRNLFVFTYKKKHIGSMPKASTNVFNHDQSESE